MSTRQAFFYSLIVMLLTLGSTAIAGSADDSAIHDARARRREFGSKLMDELVATPVSKEGLTTYAPVYALACLYTGTDLDRANEQLRSALKAIAGEDNTVSVDEALDAKWRMRTWLRVYYFFNDKSPFFPGRLAQNVQAQLEEMLFLYGCGKSTVERANLKNIWHIQGSENHDMMDLSNAYLALQAIQHLPAYTDRKLPDGHNPTEHVKAWEAYYAQYALERAKNGLFVEISPTYGKWFIGEIVNMYEFAQDPTVRHRMKLLLDLTWADWSIDQLNGIRGGGKTRCYQGSYSQSGGSDSWNLMGKALMGIKGWYWASNGIQSQLILSTSRYEPPDVVMDIALDKGSFTPFVYQSTRPAKVAGGGGGRGFYDMDPKAGGMLRYSYCTPDYIMGGWMLDTRTDYAAINTQNRWQGIVFATGPNARVFPQSVGLGNGKTYNQHIAVQHRNVMLVATHPNAKQTGQMRVYFPKDIQERIVEKDGWLVVHEGAAWLGVKFLDADPNATGKNYEFKQADPTQRNEASRNDNNDARWLWPKADKPTVAFVGSRESKHPTLEDFLTYLAGHEYTITDGCVSYAFKDDLGVETRMELGGKLPVPRINDKPVDLYPDKVFDSPYLNSFHGSGIVTLEKDGRKISLDFNGRTESNEQIGGNVKQMIHNPQERKAFERADAPSWRVVFSDPCTGDWKDKWFLDGEVGKVANGPEGMTLTAGPEFKNDAHHMVLWIKQSFEGDVKIEFDYTRLDHEKRCVNILYIQATGSGEGPYDKDITKWNDLRKVPAMKMYYDNMNTYHVSYAAFGNTDDDDTQYIRARRYVPHKAGLKNTDLVPDYFPTDLFQTGVKHHVTVIKKDRDIYLRIENPGQVYYCHFTNNHLPPITEGRIGLRHMFTRSATYRNIRISTPEKQDP
ncbi:MAG: DUF1961 family protein [Phycisphaera sp.]|nr:DUF1961 family protein [Phycisphaera sp.]